MVYAELLVVKIHAFSVSGVSDLSTIKLRTAINFVKALRIVYFNILNDYNIIKIQILYFNIVKSQNSSRCMTMLSIRMNKYHVLKPLEVLVS